MRNSDNSHLLRPTQSAEDWAAYHAIRRDSIFAVHLAGQLYDEKHPDEFKASNLPHVLTRGDEVVGTVRACNPESLRAVANNGMLAIQWDVSSGDPSPGLSPKLMARHVLAAVRPGSIVLFHANGRGWHTQSALPKIVAAPRAQGYEFATVSELRGGSKCDFRPSETR